MTRIILTTLFLASQFVGFQASAMPPECGICNGTEEACEEARRECNGKMIEASDLIRQTVQRLEDLGFDRNEAERAIFTSDKTNQ